MDYFQIYEYLLLQVGTVKIISASNSPTNTREEKGQGREEKRDTREGEIVNRES